MGKIQAVERMVLEGFSQVAHRRYRLPHLWASHAVAYRICTNVAFHCKKWPALVHSCNTHMNSAGSV